MALQISHSPQAPWDQLFDPGKNCLSFCLHGGSPLTKKKKSRGWHTHPSFTLIRHEIFVTM